MSQTRGILVPVEHLMAEMAAQPLASMAALQLSVVRLEADLRPPTASLWRAVEEQLIRSFPSFSIDEMIALRDWLWFHEIPRASAVHLSEYLERVAQSTLVFSGNVFRPRLPPWSTGSGGDETSTEDARARRFWRWVSFALPPDLLMAAHPAPNAYSSDVELVSPVLSRVLKDHGYVEPHMHVGAALDFPLQWIATLHALADRSLVKEREFRSPGGVMNEGMELAGWLVRAAIARYLLGIFLDRASRDEFRSFDDFLNREVCSPFDEPVPRDGDTPGFRGRAFAEPSTPLLVRRCLRELAVGKLDPETRFDMLQLLYIRLTNIPRRWRRFPTRLADAYAADPLQGVFPARASGQRSSEMEWVAAGLHYLRRCERDSRPGGALGEHRRDDAFAHLFWQVIRVRCLYYRHVVQRPLTPGLQWFVRFFSRVWPGRGPVSLELQVESAAQSCGREHGLLAMEFRTTPRSNQSEMEGVVKQSCSAIHHLKSLEEQARGPYRAEPPPGEEASHRAAPAREGTEYGLVLHFSRERGGGAELGLPKAIGHDSHADPFWPANVGYRFGWFYKQKRREAHTLARLLRRFPRALAVIRGLDLCTDELGVPMWVMAPLCRFVREVSEAASAHLQEQWREHIPPLRFTVHTGEEFVHLASGLRRIDETLDYLHLSQGDRLGHAVALGVNPREWAHRCGGIAITRMDRLLDLAWEWSFSTDRKIEISGSRIQFIIDQIEHLSREIFGEFADPPQVARFARLLQKEQELRLLGFPNGPLPDIEEYVRERRMAGVQDQIEFDRIRAASEVRAAGGGGAQDIEIERLRNELQRLYHALPSMFKIRQGDEPWRLLARYLIEPETFHRGQTMILVDPLFEADIVGVMQRELRRKIASLGLTVEINPSSNLLIGNMADLENHPLWRLKPPVPKEEGPSVAVCIGSDDPLTFATKTREEYQLIYDTLTLAGMTDVQARSWLEEARKAGRVSRFTLPKIPDRGRMFTGMDVDISHIRPLL